MFEEIVLIPANTLNTKNTCRHVTNRVSTNAFSVECSSHCAGDMRVLCTNGNYFYCS